MDNEKEINELQSLKENIVELREQIKEQRASNTKTDFAVEYADDKKSDTDKEARSFFDSFTSGNVQIRTALTNLPSVVAVGSGIVDTVKASNPYSDYIDYYSVNKNGYKPLAVTYFTSSTAGSIVPENGTISVNSDETAVKTLNTYKIASKAAVSVETIKYNPAAAIEVIEKKFKSSFTKGVKQQVLSGTGVNQALGLIAGGTNGKTTAAVDAITAKEFYEVVAAVGMSNSTKVALSSKTFQVLRATLNTAEEGTVYFDTARGKWFIDNMEVIFDESIAGIAASAKPVIVADFDAVIGYIADDVEIMSKGLNDSGQMEYVGFLYHDFEVADSSKVKYITMAAE